MWRTILRRFGPREDAGQPFYPDRLDPQGPVLLNEMGPLSATLVAARVLRAIALRRGTRVGPTVLERVENLVARGLSEAARNHCNAEAESVLEWIHRAPPTTEPHVDGVSDSPELDLMVAADLESRLTVAKFALVQGYDLELEYFDEDRQIWPRIRAAIDDIDGEEAADFNTALLLQGPTGPLEVPLKFVRWLMPVAPRPGDGSEPPPGGDLLQFPGTDDP